LEDKAKHQLRRSSTYRKYWQTDK